MTARNSHLAALNLVRNPFPYTPDAGCYFTTPYLDEQMVELAHCVQSRKGFSLLTAEVGMGKSTLVRHLMTDLAPKQVVSALVFNTFLQGPELLAAVLQDFGLASSGTMSSDITVLNEFLLENHLEGKTCLLIIDDAQNLSESSLELIRLLCNLETDQEKLLQIMLAGQPELETTLAQHNLRQLRSRVVKHTRLHGLNSTEIADYVKFRFESSGSDGSLLLQADACQMLWKESQGVPRQIHLIMDRCLYGLVAKNGNVIDTGLMRQAIADSRVNLIGPATDAAVQVAQPKRKRTMAYLVGVLGIAMVGGAAWTKVGPDNAAAQLTELIRPSSASIPAPVAQPVSEQAAMPLKAAAALNTPADRGVAGAAVEQVAMQAPEKPLPGAMADEGPSICLALSKLPLDRMVISQPLPDLTHQLLGSRLERLKEACLSTRQGQPWLTWSTPLNGYDLSKHLTAARFQIALTQYGSLLPREVDGVWGEKSRGALKAFQSTLGLTSTGEIDALSGLLLERFYVQEQ